MAEQNPMRRWLQFNLKTLMLLPVVVGIGTYWYDWAKHRPPYKEYAKDEYPAACDEFFDDLDAGRLDHAYESTSARFKEQMSRSEFETTVGRYLALQPIEEGVVAQGTIPIYANYVLDRNWCYRSRAGNGPGKKVTEFCVWVLTDVSDDSFFYRRPPPPRVEEIQIREFSQAEWKSETMPELKPSWERE